ncbi:hypothetical protein Tco_1254072 [Tanacetum coccineum]
MVGNTLECLIMDVYRRISTEQYDSVQDSDEEEEDQELEAHYVYMAKIQEDDSKITPDSLDMCNDEGKVDQDTVQEEEQIIMFIVDSGCTKHMTGNLKLLIKFVEKFLVQCLMSTSKGENEVVSKPSDVSNKEHTTQSTRKTIAAESPQLIVHNTPDPTTLTTQVHAKEDTNIQADDAVFNAYDSLIRLLHQ